MVSGEAGAAELAAPAEGGRGVLAVLIAGQDDGDEEASDQVVGRGLVPLLLIALHVGFGRDELYTRERGQLGPGHGLLLLPVFFVGLRR
jgi:hypothetical protein